MSGHQQPSDSSHALTQRLNVDFALQAAGLGVWELDPTTKQVVWDEQCQQLFGLAKGKQLSYQQAIRFIHPDDIGRVDQAVQKAITWPSDGRYDVTYRTLGADDGLLRWVRFMGKAEFTESGESYRFAGVAQEVTQSIMARQQLEESERNLRNIITQAPVAMSISKGPTHIIELANERMYTIWGQRPEMVLNKPVFEIFPETVGQSFKTILDQVYTAGEVYRANELAITLTKGGNLETIYLNAVYEPLRDGQGTIVGIMQVAIDVTEQVLAHQKLAEVEARLQTIITHLPSATVVFRGRELVVETPSQNFINIIDRGPNVVGKPLGELMPELESQSYLKILDDVYTSGQAFRTFGTPVDIRQEDGSTTRDFFDLIYTPLFNAQEQVYAILSVATNVTDIIKAHQQVEASEAALRNAIELAKLATWKMDVATGQMTYSERLQNWLGVQDAVQGLRASPRVHPKDRDRVSQAIKNALIIGGNGHYDEVYTITNALSGQEYVIHASGQTEFDDSGCPVTLSGTAQDVTLERELQLALEKQVQQRTEELAAANKELLATNEDFLASNRALETANLDLIHSNQNLEQFAYIASHDLQEPLRKIQQFGDLLKTRYGKPEGEELIYLERMQTAASRMSLLIKDLLAFSRISTSQVSLQPVSLTPLVNQVLETLSVAIEESDAQIQQKPLPTIQGDSLQLSQLFQNLLSNALKFRRQTPTGEAITPQITIRASQVSSSQLPATLQPSRYAERYHLIEVIDNGIGFEEKYQDRIFQVFQRLHGKHEFAGTGVGLAIVQKVVNNHGGAITAHSKPGQGATFSVYLPV